MSQRPAVQPEIEVLLATFNGARFLRPQIESILGQSWQTTRILARDDGSTDDTPALLNEYAARLPARFRVLPTDRPTGSAKLNFAVLLQHSTAPWVAFADQDDVWLPQKLEACAVAMEQLEQTYGKDRPLLVFSDLEVVSEELATIHASFWNHEGVHPANIHHLERLLLQNVVTGCTMLINRPLARLSAPMPAEAVMHDRWIGLLASLYGQAAFIAEPLVRYRQHAGNVVGASGPRSPQDLLRSLSHAGRRKQWILSVRQAGALLRSTRTGGDLPHLTAAQESTLDALIRSAGSPNRFSRVATLLRQGIGYSSPVRTAALIVFLLSRQADPTERLPYEAEG